MIVSHYLINCAMINRFMGTWLEIHTPLLLRLVPFIHLKLDTYAAWRLSSPGV